MKYLTILLFAFLIFTVKGQTPISLASELQKPNKSEGKFILDQANKLTEDQINTINQYCKNIFDQSGIETMIAIVPGFKPPFGDTINNPQEMEDPAYYFIDYLFDEWELDKNEEQNIGDLLVLIDAEENYSTSMSSSIPVEYNGDFLSYDLAPSVHQEEYFDGLINYLLTVYQYTTEDQLPQYITDESYRKNLDDIYYPDDIFEELEFANNEYFTVSQVPNEMVKSGSFVTDPSDYLSEVTVANINQKCNAIKLDKGFEIAVVVLESISLNSAHDFGVELFNFWEVGN